MDDFWDRIVDEEENEEGNYLTGYQQENIEEERGEDGRDEEDEQSGYDEEEAGEDEFNAFKEDEEPDLQVGYAQLQHVSFGDPGLGMTIRTKGGKVSKLEKLLGQHQGDMKEKLYIQKLKAELSNYVSFEVANDFGIITEKYIPRYWLKNIPALAATFYMINQLRKEKLTSKYLESFSETTGVRKEDLYRYYKLVKEYCVL
jgi:hypothetical protein